MSRFSARLICGSRAALLKETRTVIPVAGLMT